MHCTLTLKIRKMNQDNFLPPYKWVGKLTSRGVKDKVRKRWAEIVAKKKAALFSQASPWFKLKKKNFIDSAFALEA